MAAKFPKLPNSISELVDGSIYSYACAQGLRKGKHIRSDIVVRGTTTFLSNMLESASKETKQEFERSGNRFGGWSPGRQPTGKLKTFLVSRLRRLESTFHAYCDPTAPTCLEEVKETFDEGTQRVRRSRRARCWRCGGKCRNCKYVRKNGKQAAFFFRADIEEPFLDTLEEMLEEETLISDSSDDANEDNQEDEDERTEYATFLEKLSGNETESEEEDSENDDDDDFLPNGAEDDDDKEDDDDDKEDDDDDKEDDDDDKEDDDDDKEDDDFEEIIDSSE